MMKFEKIWKRLSEGKEVNTALVRQAIQDLLDRNLKQKRDAAVAEEKMQAANDTLRETNKLLTQRIGELEEAKSIDSPPEIAEESVEGDPPQAAPVQSDTGPAFSDSQAIWDAAYGASFALHQNSTEAAVIAAKAIFGLAGLADRILQPPTEEPQ